MKKDSTKKTATKIAASDGAIEAPPMNIGHNVLFDRVSDAIFVISGEGGFINANISFCRLFEYEKEELKELKIADLMAPNALISAGKEIENSLGGEQILTEWQMTTKTGLVLAMEINIALFGNNMLLAIGKNVTQTKTAQKTLQLSEERFRGAFEYAAIGMALVSLDGKWLKVNKELCNIIGYSEADLLALTFQDITHPEDLDRDLQYLYRAVAGEIDYYRMEKRYICSNGQLIWARLNVSIVRDEQKAPLYFISQIENIDNEKRITETLKENINLMQLFVEHSPAALAMLDTDLNYLQVSKRWIVDYDLKTDDITGKNHYEVFADMPERWKDIHKRCLMGEEIRSEEDFYQREDGSIEWLHWEVRPWYKASGKIGGLIMFSEVITKIKEEQLKFQNLVERSLVGVYIVQDGKFVYVNPQLVEESGYLKAELLGMPIEALIHPEDIGRAKENIEKRTSGRVKADQYEIRGIKKDGSVIWLELYGTVTVYKRMPALIGTVVNVTERRKIHKELMKSEANLRSIFDTTKVAYLLLDEQYNIAAFNTYYQNQHLELNGVKVAVGDNFIEIISVEKREWIRGILDKVKDTLVSEQHEIGYNNSAVERYFQVTVSAVVTEGRVLGICISATDITSQKNMDLERQRVTKDLIQRNTDLEHFSQMVSHNLRGPLATVLGMCEMLGHSDHEDKFAIDGIKASAHNLDLVVKDLNKVLLIRRELSEVKVTVNLEAIAQQVIGSIRLLIKEKNAVIKLDFGEAGEILSVKSYISSIFFNLITNSLKFSNPERNVEIRIWSVKKKGKVEINFEDNGIGMDLKKYGDKLFLPYNRFNRNIEGKGLGLFMVKTQVEVLNGTIVVQSKPNAGTSVLLAFDAI